MKMISAAVSFLRPAATAAVLVLFSLLLIGWAEQAASLPVDRSLSEPLRNPQTHQAVQDISKHAQGLQTEDDSSSRLMPRVNTDQDHMKICCLHANILDFYVNNILNKLHGHHVHPNMTRLRVDMNRVSEDLQNQGCNVTHYQDHRHAVQFRRTLNKLGEKGLNKAVGEIDILFMYLQDFCVLRSNATATAN